MFAPSFSRTGMWRVRALLVWGRKKGVCTLPLVRSYQPLQETHSRSLSRRVPSQVTIAITVMACYAANSPSIGNKLAGQRQLKRKALAPT